MRKLLTKIVVSIGFPVSNLFIRLGTRENQHTPLQGNFPCLFEIPKFSQELKQDLLIVIYIVAVHMGHIQVNYY